MKKNDDYIYRKAANGNGNWQRIGGRLKHVSVGPTGWVWGVNRNNQIYKCEKPCDRGWKEVNGRLKNVSGGKTKVWGTSHVGDVYHRPIDGSPSTPASTWTKVPSENGIKFNTISAVDPENVWTTTANGDVYKCIKPCSHGTWEKVTRPSNMGLTTIN